MIMIDLLLSRISCIVYKFAPVLLLLIKFGEVCQVGPHIAHYAMNWKMWIIWSISVQYVQLWHNMTNCDQVALVL